MRPPLRTAELRAYNFGSKVRAAGFGLAPLIEARLLGAMLPFGPEEERAEAELGTAGFKAWAVRGYTDHEYQEAAT